MNKKKTVSKVALLTIGIVALGLIAAVYAKYTSTITKTGSVTVAKWAFSTDNTSGSIQCPLDETYDPSTLVSGKIAPGTSGYCPISISNANTEVGVSYVITPDTTNNPTNMKFYTDSAHQHPITAQTQLSGTLAPNASASTVTIYWGWDYQDGTTTYDENDTDDGSSATGQATTLTFNIVGTQIQPTAAP